MEAASSTSLRSRRALIAAGLGGLAATAAHALGRPLPAQAGHDTTNVLHIGEFNVAPEGATTTLLIDGAGSGQTGFGVHDPNGQAVAGSSSSGIGVFGNCETGQGGQFHSVSGRGVLGKSQSYAGVQGTSDTGNGGEFFSGELAQGNGFGVLGVSGSGEGGHFQSTSGNGCVGSSGSANGVYGLTASANGVSGSSGALNLTGAGGYFSGASLGVRGDSDTPRGVGVYAFSPSGTALRADGAVRFSTASLATILAGSNSVTVSPGIALTGQSKVLCTLQSDPGARSIKFVAVDVSADTFTVALTGKAMVAVSVACFVMS